MYVKVVSIKGDGLGLAYHLSSEGHKIGFDLMTRSGLGVGLLDPGVSNQRPDLAIYDSPVEGQAADVLRSTGVHVLGSSHWAEMIDKNPEYQRSLIDAIGWSQSELTTGTHVYVTTWFNGNTFIATYASLVYRRLMTGGNGPDIGATGVIGNFYQPTDTIYNKILHPLEPILKRVNHRGCFHIHLLVDGDAFQVKEISANLGHPLSLLLLENGRGSCSNIILRTLDVTSKSIQPREKWAAGVLLSIPPFPYAASAELVELKGIVWEAVKHMWLTDVKVEEGKWYSTGYSGKLGWVTARGGYPLEAVGRVYRTISNLSIPNLQYRTDIGKETTALLNRLEEYHWLI